MNDFYALSKIKTAIYDNNFNIILGVPHEDSKFCIAIKKSKNGLKNCDLCTRNAIQEVRKKNSLVIYKCHAGLIEAVAPIRINGVIVGYMMLGQVCEKDDKYLQTENLLLKEKYSVDNFEECITSLTVKSYSEIKAASKIMESCVCYLLMNHVITESEGSIAFDINNYILQNLSHSLTCRELCMQFEISRNMLYKISDTYFGMPIAQYINLKRIEKAKELIKDGISVTKVAEMTGFCDYGYFGKVFKKFTGITPRMWKAHQKLTDVSH